MCGLAAPAALEAPPVADERRLRSIGMRYLYVGPGSGSRRVLVAVHGVAREWRELLPSFTERCVAAGAALVIPRFSRCGYRGYQRLEVGRRGLAADQALLRVLDDVATRTGTPTEDLRLFGYSGGAQFAHRFSLLHPHLVSRQVLAAAGFYTMPAADAAYPYGLGGGASGNGIDPRGLTTPTRVFVGDLDVVRDAQLRTNRRLDLQQGAHRLERARRFVVAVRALAASLGTRPECSLEVLRGCGHSFVECDEAGALARKAAEFLLPDQPLDRTPAPAVPITEQSRRGGPR
ncbi:MAG: hypothetical protein ACE5EG_06615 [Thermoanaerobaculia bacterium]